MTTDPIDSDDVGQLRQEILRLRDQVSAGTGREEVLTDLVAERDHQLAELDAHASALAEELARNPVVRLGRALKRQIGRA